MNKNLDSIGSRTIGSVATPVGWFSIGLFLFFAALSYRDDGLSPSTFLFIGFSLLGVGCLLIGGRYEVSSHAIVQRTIWGTFRIGWDEILEVEIGHNQQCFIFHGQNKRFAMAGPEYWMGRDTAEVKAMIQLEIDARRIPQRTNPRAMWKSHRNTRIPDKTV